MHNSDDDDPKFRLRPRKPPIYRERKSAQAWSIAFRTVMKHARMSRAGRRNGTGGRSPSFLQNCAVRVSYSSNRVAGHWRAHGRYLARENASMESDKAGFNAEGAAVDIAATLQQWQSNSDPRLWKLILSPEFGERVEPQRFARDVMKGMEADLRTSLDWVAVAHFNTEHPHVHVALRGVDKNGVEFKLPRDYVKNGLRGVAQHFVTAQIGHRTEQDAALAFQRQVPEQRLTPLDRSGYPYGPLAFIR
jgi:type IV secretory pathway VirD2 relaxase